MPPAARLTDMHVCPMVTPGTPPVPHVGGPIMPPCYPPVLIGGLPAARVTDLCICVGPPDTIVKGSMTVMIGYQPAARMGDLTAHGGVITTGCPTVVIGDMGGGGLGDISAMPLADKMLAAIRQADLSDSVLAQLGDLKVLVGSILAVSGLLAAIAATGLGAVAEGIAAVLLLAGAFLSGAQIGEGLVALADFVRLSGNAKTADDLKLAGARFADGIAAIGVGGVNVALSVAGARGLAATKPSAAMAEGLANAARAAEPKITTAMQEAAARNGGELTGLQYRLKEQASMERKILTDMSEQGISLGEAAGRISDAVRYTALAPEGRLAEMTSAVLVDLKSQGFKISKVKNTWRSPDAPYKGINVQAVSPQGHPVEIQFHTPESFALKQETHGLYEVLRTPGTSDAEAAVLLQKMKFASSAIRTPPAIDRIKPYP